MDISAGVVVREGQLVRKGPELVSILQWALSYIWSENSHPKSEGKDGGIWRAIRRQS